MMDKKFGIYWHVIVGEGFGFEVAYESRNMMYMFFAGNLAVVVWKCSWNRVLPMYACDYTLNVTYIYSVHTNMVYVPTHTDTINQTSRKRTSKCLQIHFAKYINTIPFPGKHSLLWTFPQNNRQVTGKKHIQKIIRFVCHLESEIFANNHVPIDPELFVHRILNHSCSRL